MEFEILNDILTRSLNDLLYNEYLFQPKVEDKKVASKQMNCINIINLDFLNKEKVIIFFFIHNLFILIFFFCRGSWN